jgi:hypothetical protein
MGEAGLIMVGRVKRVLDPVQDEQPLERHREEASTNRVERGCAAVRDGVDETDEVGSPGVRGGLGVVPCLWSRIQDRRK